MKGKIISISGFDGSGKTTQLNILKDYYYKQNKTTASIFDISSNENYENKNSIKEYYKYFESFDVIYTRFYLRSKNTKELIEKLLYSKKAFLKTEVAYQLFLSCKKDAELWFDEVVLPLYEKGKIFLFDRYYYDEILYRSLYNLNLNQLINEYKDTVIIPSDYSFYLHLSLEKIMNRNRDRNDSKTTLFNNNDKIIELYNKFENNSNNLGLIRIEGDNSKEQVQNSILSFLENNE